MIDFLLLRAPDSAGLSVPRCPVGTLYIRFHCWHCCVLLTLYDMFIHLIVLLVHLHLYFCVTNKLDWIGENVMKSIAISVQKYYLFSP